MKKLFNELFSHKRLAGVEVLFPPEGGAVLNAILLKKEKNKILKEQELPEAGNYEALSRFVGKQIPLVLVIRGKGIIAKSISQTKGENPQQTIQRAMPGINVKETCSQIRNTSGRSELQLVRKAVLSDILQKLNDLDLRNFIACYIDNETNTDLTDIISPCFGTPEKGVEDHEGLNVQIAEHNERYQTRVKSLSLIGGVFLILLINYFIFDHFQSGLQQLNIQLEQHKDAMLLNERLKKEYDTRKELIERKGFLEGSRSSFYADRAAAILPAGIQWNKLEVYPLRKKVTNESNFEFENHQVIIKGSCRQSTVLNDWLKKMRDLQWVSSVSLTDYSQSSANENGQFTIDLRLK